MQGVYINIQLNDCLMQKYLLLDPKRRQPFVYFKQREITDKLNTIAPEVQDDENPEVKCFCSIMYTDSSDSKKIKSITIDLERREKDKPCYLKMNICNHHNLYHLGLNGMNTQEIKELLVSNDAIKSAHPLLQLIAKCKVIDDIIESDV